MSGFSDGYDEWLSAYLGTENPLSDIVLNLSLCSSDVNKTISYLHNYCLEQPLDEKFVCDKLRLFLKSGYNSNRFNKEDVITLMYRFTVNHANYGDFNAEIWSDMFYMDDYHALAKDNIISMERFVYAFESYLNQGVPFQSIYNL